MFRKICGIMLSVFSMASYANCESLIELSKIVKTTTSDETLLEQHAASFCNEYKSHHADNGTHNFGASYKFLSASYGSSGASVDDVASKYCSAGADTSARSDAYKQYVEAIAPGAFSAYDNCINSNKDLVFSLNEGSILPTSFMLTASFISRSIGVNFVDVQAIASSNDVTCKWDDTKSPKKEIKSGGTAILNCSRTDQTKRVTVTIAGTTIASSPAIVMPWKAYDKNGNPIDTIVSMSENIRSMSEKIRRLEGSLINSVIAFASNSCPEGWVDYKEAYGRFVRGIDITGKIDPDGTRGFGGTQEDSFKAHEHRIQVSYYQGVSSGWSMTHNNPASLAENGKMQPEGGLETRPKNVALLYCIRK